ncbi:MAG: hypothetical protein JRJ69_18460 [Deltaproteobacteria bacterium]|nr:hypothetical protein [Deltaproteobacteria bacterium]
MAHSEELIRELEEKADVVRKNVLTIFENSQLGHVGGTMSIVDIVTALYFHHMKIDPKNCVRKNVLTIFENSQLGHVGGTMSIVDIVTALYFHHMKIDLKNCDWPERDRLVLSKAHSCEAIYAIFAEIGWIAKEKLSTYYRFGSPLQGHADRWCTPGMDYSGGSLGQGLSWDRDYLLLPGWL